MQTKAHEIAGRIYRLSTCVPDAAPGGVTFNQFLVDADAPLLFHTGPRRMFPLVSESVAGIVPLHRLRWIAFGHMEPDECGAMNEFLAAAPHAQVAHGAIGKTVRGLATLEPHLLALMHGSSTRSRCSEALLHLADASDSMSRRG